MELELSLKKILKKAALSSELEFQRASILDRRLRLLVKEHPELAYERKALRTLLKAYEDEHWAESEITNQQAEESEFAARIAEEENKFNLERKRIIRSKLKEKGLAQKDLGLILGHTSETYMSELMNGINPFTINDLILIHKLLNVRMAQLIPTTLNPQIISKVLKTLGKLNNPKLKLKMEDLVES